MNSQLIRDKVESILAAHNHPVRVSVARFEDCEMVVPCFVTNAMLRDIEQSTGLPDLVAVYIGLEWTLLTWGSVPNLERVVSGGNAN